MVEQELKPNRVSRQPVDGEKRKEETHTEPQPVRFLREYSNYLTPRMGLLSADTWAMVAIYLRNLLLNQAILTLFLFSILLLPYCVVYITELMSQSHRVMYAPAPLAVFVLVTLALCVGTQGLKEIETGGKTASPTKAGRLPQSLGWIAATIIAPISMAAWVLTGWLWLHPNFWNENAHWWEWVVGGFVGVSAPWMISVAFGPKPQSTPKDEFEKRHRRWTWILTSLLSGPLAGLLLYAAAHKIFPWLVTTDGKLFHAISFGVPLTLMVFLLTAVIQMGLMGWTFFDIFREWWARVAGWIFIVSIVWAAAFGMAFYAPLGLMWLRGWLSAVGLTWVIATVAGVIGGKNSKTGEAGSKKWSDVALSLTPYVFIVGLLSLLSLSLELILARLSMNWAVLCAKHPGAWDHFLSPSPAVAKVANWVLNLSGSLTSPSLSLSGTAMPKNAEHLAPEYLAAHWQMLGTVTNAWLLLLCLGAFLACLFLSWRVNLNEFSMNLFYRNRLVRCYLGASHADRQPNTFTGLDWNDDLCLKDLRSESCYSGPFPIINSTLNLVSTRNLAWQERKAESFSMTPLRCGYDTWLERIDLSRTSPPGARNNKRVALDPYAYRPTEQYGYKDGGLFIGTAMSISGAALSPNMGYHSTPSLAALMTFFNVRLGFWAGNPRDNQTWTKPGPRTGLWWLLAELFGTTDDDAKYVYLSDGGHFENLGVYELVKRRCHYIIACDAGADPDYTLEDLGNAIRKCREDIGVEIEMSPQAVVRPKEDAYSPFHWVVGKIHYNMVDRNAVDGIFLYVKASLTGGEPADVLNYAKAHQDFPHQATADQWFTESQFESYRRLGQHIIETIFEKEEVAEQADQHEAFKERRAISHLLKALESKLNANK